MTTDIKETLIDWLRDAYAMESQAVEMLERQADRIQNYPEVLTKVREHIATSKTQADRLKQCLTHLGSDTSAIKTGVGMLLGNAQSLSGIVVGDEIVKAGIFNYAFEQFEIANYLALIAAADVAGEPEIRRLCEESLAEEQQMAAWIETRLPQLTKTYLARKVTMGTSEAKR